MDRKPKSEEVTEKIVLEELHGETQPYDLDEENDPEKTEKLDLREVEKPTKKSKKKRKKKAHKKNKASEEKTDELDLQEPVEIHEEEIESDDSETEVLTAEPPKKERRKRRRRKNDDGRTDDDSLRADVSITTTAMHKSMEAMVKQWDSLKQISEGVTRNLDRVSNSLKEIPSTFEKSMQPAKEVNRARMSSNNRLTMGISIVAIVLSFISLVFSQNIRKTVLHDNLVTNEALSEAKVKGRSTPSEEAPAVAVKPRKKKINNRPRTKKRRRKSRR